MSLNAQLRKRRRAGRIQPKPRRFGLFGSGKSKQADFDRDFPDCGRFGWDRKAVCKRCHCVLVDHEPSSHYGEFWHPSLDKAGKPHTCRNSGKMFGTQDLEIVPFLPKARRRFLKRAGIRP